MSRMRVVPSRDTSQRQPASGHVRRRAGVVVVGVLSVGMLVGVSIVVGVMLRLMQPSAPGISDHRGSGPLRVPDAGAGAGAGVGPDETLFDASTPTRVLAPATPACRRAGDERGVVARYIELGDWDTAATYAEGVLGLPRLCADDRADLTRSALTARYEALFARKFDPLDMVGQREAAELYASLRQRGATDGVLVPGAGETAQRAYEQGLFVLTKDVLDDAYRRGDFAPTNQTLVQLYCSALFNQGMWLTTEGYDAAQRAEGVRWLVTSYRIDQDPRYRVGQGAAWGALNRLVGPDETMWPEPVESPLL